MLPCHHFQNAIMCEVNLVNVRGEKVNVRGVKDVRNLTVCTCTSISLEASILEVLLQDRLLCCSEPL